MKKIFAILFLTAITLVGLPVLAINCTDCSDSCKDNENFKNCYNDCLSGCTNTEAAAATANTNANKADTSNNNGVQIPNPLGENLTIPQLANRFITLALGLSGVLALIAFIYGGVMYLTAGVNSKNVQTGKDAMKWAVIGLFLIFSSYAIVSFILKDILGVK